MVISCSKHAVGPQQLSLLAVFLGRRGPAVLLQGLTAWHLYRTAAQVRAGETVVVHAAAGGVGSLACQWASSLGATVIGTVGSDDKIAVARANGCAHVINYRREDFVARTRALTDGEGEA